LDFEIELLSWQSETDLTKDGGVLKRSIEDGKGWDQPKEGSTVTVHLVGRVNDGGAAREFVNTRATEQPVTFVIGEGTTRVMTTRPPMDSGSLRLRFVYGVAQCIVQSKRLPVSRSASNR